jgi:hypothetical protein
MRFSMEVPVVFSTSRSIFEELDGALLALLQLLEVLRHLVELPCSSAERVPAFLLSCLAELEHLRVNGSALLIETPNVVAPHGAINLSIGVM